MLPAVTEPYERDLGLLSVPWVSSVSVRVSGAAWISECIRADLCFPLVLLGSISQETQGYQIQVCSTLCQGCSYTRGTWCNLDSQLVSRSAELVYPLSLKSSCLWLSRPAVLYTKKGFERTAVRIGKVKTSAAERRKKSTLGLTRGCMPSHIAQEAVTVRLGRVDGLSKADVLLCPIRLMYVSSEETTVLRSHIAPPPHPHHHLLFLCLGACLLNPASGKWPGPSIHTVHIRACSGFMAQT